VIWAITCPTLVGIGAVEPIHGQDAARAGVLASGVGPAADHSPAAATMTVATTALVQVARARAWPADVIGEEVMRPPGGWFPACSRNVPVVSGKM